ncbi:hypothetical protein [Mesorhizobium sp. M0676]|uniref:hypothetical protein n=1 Tax=Mesorhizobium sp. M0676 TaxID=2956984 RepID=UPI00333635CF
MTAPAGCQLMGRWRIIAADLWDRGYLDLGGPATITIGADNHGEIAFGALQASLDLGYSPRWSSSQGRLRRDGRSHWRRLRRNARRRLDRDHLRLSQRRRGDPQIQARYIFNSLLDEKLLALSKPKLLIVYECLPLQPDAAHPFFRLVSRR